MLLATFQNYILIPCLCLMQVRGAEQCKAYIGKEQKNQCFKHLLQNQLLYGKVRLSSVVNIAPEGTLELKLKWNFQRILLETGDEKLFFFVHIQNTTLGCQNVPDVATSATPPSSANFSLPHQEFKTTTTIHLPHDEFAAKTGQYAIFAGVICTNCPHRKIYWMEGHNGLAGRTWVATIGLDKFSVTGSETKQYSDHCISSSLHSTKTKISCALPWEHDG